VHDLIAAYMPQIRQFIYKKPYITGFEASWRRTLNPSEKRVVLKIIQNFTSNYSTVLSSKK
jgi:hypothetical protein